jgi:pimeloyl-ACP methyl ester carboxylesterase
MRRAQQRKVRDGGLAAVVRDELKPAYVAPANRNRRDILGLAFAMAIDLGPEVFLRQSEALITRPDARPGLRAIDCPTMILCGAEDPVCPPAWHRELAARIRGAELQLISGAGHLPPLEQPRRFTDAVTHWLSRVEKEHEWAAAAIEF